MSRGPVEERLEKLKRELAALKAQVKDANAAG
jgi:ribosomal protein L29